MAGKYKDPEYMKKYLKKYYEENGERLRANMRDYQKEYWAKNRDKINAASRARYALNREKMRERARTYKLQGRFKLSEDEYNTLLKLQNGVCAICLKPESASSRTGLGIKRLAVDHDHNNKKIRGLLCMVCNTKLGIFEGWEYTESAQKYINYHNNDKT